MPMERPDPREGGVTCPHSWVSLKYTLWARVCVHGAGRKPSCTRSGLLAFDSEAGDPTPATGSSGGSNTGAGAWQPSKPRPPEATAVPPFRRGSGGVAAEGWRGAAGGGGGPLPAPAPTWAGPARAGWLPGSAARPITHLRGCQATETEL